MSSEDAGSSTATPLGVQLGTLKSDLARGARGPEVAAVNAYLVNYGYFPNRAIEQQYPRWAPVAASPADASVYDENTEIAIRALQQTSNLEVTGVVDAPTRALLKSARCDIPDNTESLSFAASDKFDFFFDGMESWKKPTVTWKIASFPAACPVPPNTVLTQAQVITAITNAFTTWSQNTGLVFSRITSGTADITINFDGTDFTGNPETGLATANPTPQNGEIVRGVLGFNTNQNPCYSVSSSSPIFDIQTIVTHELGHLLGLAHGTASSVMYFQLNVGTLKKLLQLEDIEATSLLYGAWGGHTTPTNDVATAANEAVWAVSNVAAPGGFRISKLSGTAGNTTTPDGAGVRITVGNNYFPIIANDAGEIWRRTTEDPTLANRWVQVPGCAFDVAGSFRSGTGGSLPLYVVGCNEGAGTGSAAGSVGWQVKYTTNNGTTWVNTEVYGYAITLSPTGIPWVVDNNGDIWRAKSAQPHTTGWEKLLWIGGEGAWDIAADSAGGNWVWAIGGVCSASGCAMHLWNQQTATTATNERRRWVAVPGNGRAYNVALNRGHAWVNDAFNGTFHWIP